MRRAGRGRESKARVMANQPPSRSGGGLRRPTREQMDQLVEAIMTLPPAELARSYRDKQGELRFLDEGDPPFFAKVMAESRDHGLVEGERGEGPTRRVEISDRLRAEVIARDDWTCYLCGWRLTWEQIHLDHIHPVSLGGESVAENLGVACAYCNMAKGNRLSPKRPAALGGTTPPADGDCV